MIQNSVYRVIIRLICCLVLSHLASAQELKVPDDIIFRSGVSYREGQASWKMDYALPKKTEKPIPAIVMVHGGGWLEGDKSSFDQYCIDFAKQEYFCATINYRLSGEAPFPAAVEDCKCAVRWIRAHAKEFNIDVNRIGSYGNSAGGHLALMLVMADKDAGLEGDGPWLAQSSMVQCAVSDSGIVNLDYNIPNNRGVVKQTDMFLAGPENSLKERMLKASPTSYVKPTVPPLLLLYGVDDAQVTIGPVDDFVSALRHANVSDVSYIRLAKVGHCPFSLVKIPWTRNILEDFYRRTLKP